VAITWEIGQNVGRAEPLVASNATTWAGYSQGLGLSKQLYLYHLTARAKGIRGMRRYVIIATALSAICCILARAQSGEEELIQKMSNDELAEYFMVKECSATLYLVCTDKEKVKARYNTPEVRRNALAINRKLNHELYREEIEHAVDDLGLDPSEAHHGHMVKECGLFSCSWVYKK
jgi:hypothetical protein